MRVVFLHAFPLNGRMWDNVRTPDSVAPDLYDLGETMTTWAHRALVAAGQGPLVLVGCSMGVSCALEMTRIAPDRIIGLVLVGGKAGVRHEPDLRDAYIDTLRLKGPDALLDEFAPSFFGPDSEIEQARKLMHAQSVEQLVRGVRAFHTRPDASGVLADFKGEVRIVRGEHDAIGRHRPAELGTIEVPGAGHYVNLDQPEAFTAILREVLSGRRGGAALRGSS